MKAWFTGCFLVVLVGCVNVASAEGPKLDCVYKSGSDPVMNQLKDRHLFFKPARGDSFGLTLEARSAAKWVAVVAYSNHTQFEYPIFDCVDPGNGELLFLAVGDRRSASGPAHDDDEAYIRIPKKIDLLDGKPHPTLVDMHSGEWMTATVTAY